MKTTLIGVIVLSAAFAARPSQAASIENYIPREEAKRVAALLTRQLLSTEVDAYRPKGFAKELPEIVCYPEGRPGRGYGRESFARAADVRTARCMGSCTRDN